VRTGRGYFFGVWGAPHLIRSRAPSSARHATRAAAHASEGRHRPSTPIQSPSHLPVRTSALPLTAGCRVSLSQPLIGRNCRWNGLSSTSAMGRIADGDSVKQADGSFLHRCSHSRPGGTFKLCLGATGVIAQADCQRHGRPTTLSRTLNVGTFVAAKRGPMEIVFRPFEPVHNPDEGAVEPAIARRRPFMAGRPKCASDSFRTNLRRPLANVVLLRANAPPSRRALANRRQTKLERRTVPGIAGCPQPSSVGFDDRAAD
jgi:hypothetical protein